jgi:hypothetical protein
LIALSDFSSICYSPVKFTVFGEIFLRISVYVAYIPAPGAMIFIPGDCICGFLGVSLRAADPEPENMYTRQEDWLTFI